MQLRRVLPLSLVALLASAGCVSVGPQGPDGPARGSVPPADAPDAPAADGSAGPGGPAGPGGAVNASDPHGLPLGKLPSSAAAPPAEAGPGASGPDPARRSAKTPRKGTEHRAKPAAPRHPHPPKAPPARSGRKPAPPASLDELCAAAEGSVPPSIVDLCLRQSGR